MIETYIGRRYSIEINFFSGPRPDSTYEEDFSFCCAGV